MLAAVCYNQTPRTDRGTEDCSRYGVYPSRLIRTTRVRCGSHAIDINSGGAFAAHARLGGADMVALSPLLMRESCLNWLTNFRGERAGNFAAVKERVLGKYLYANSFVLEPTADWTRQQV